VSESGCRLQIPHLMTPQSEVSLAMWLEGERVWMHGVITHSLYGCGAGIEFTRLQQSAKHKLSYLVASCEKEVTERREAAAEANQFSVAYSVTL